MWGRPKWEHVCNFRSGTSICIMLSLLGGPPFFVGSTMDFRNLGPVAQP